MSKIYLAIDTKEKDLPAILVERALSGKEGWIFMHVHPRIARLLEGMEKADFGHVTFDLRHGLPENVDITSRLSVEA